MTGGEFTVDTCDPGADTVEMVEVFAAVLCLLKQSLLRTLGGLIVGRPEVSSTIRSGRVLGGKPNESNDSMSKKRLFHVECQCKTVMAKMTYLRAKTTIPCNRRVVRTKNYDEDYGFS